MEKHVFEGKNIDDTKNKALEELNLKEEDLFLKEEEQESGLFKSKKTKLVVIKKKDVIEYIKNFLNKITSLMGIDVKQEVKIRDNIIIINMVSDKNSILIGKDGRTLSSLQILLKQALSNECGMSINVSLDVENYKDKRNKNLEYLANKLAREVSRTKVEVKMDNMNSFERRIIHSTLSDNKYVYTESVGEEPNRYVVIKPKED